MKLKIKKLDVKKDHRGWLAEIFRPEDVGTRFGQLLITTALPGKTKGNHYHKRKREWYCVIKGRGLLTVLDPQTRRPTRVKMGEHNMVMVEIPVGAHHRIENVGNDDLYLLAYTNEPFDAADPDTYYDETQPSQ